MRLKAVVSIFVCLMFTLTVPNLGLSQSENGQSHAAVLIPESTIEHPEDIGLRAHTNHLIRFEGKPGGGGSPSGETPASLRSVYNLPSSGGSGRRNRYPNAPAASAPVAPAATPNRLSPNATYLLAV